MKTSICSFALVSMIAFNSTSVLAGDDLPKNVMPMTQILQNLQKAGYNVVKKIEFNDDKFEAKAINYAGEDVKLEIAPVTGEVLKPKKEEAPKLSIIDAAQKVESAGYKNIYVIDASKDKYEVKAYDKNDKKVNLDVDAQTGAIKE